MGRPDPDGGTSPNSRAGPEEEAHSEKEADREERAGGEKRPSPNERADSEGRTRLRLDDLAREEFPDGRCRIRVVLTWTRERRYRGEADGTLTLQGEIRAAVEATLEAASRATDRRLALTLMGVKSIRAFDRRVVIVSVRGRSEASDYDLIGAQACPDSETTRAAVIASLDATNRILSRYLGT